MSTTSDVPIERAHIIARVTNAADVRTALIDQAKRSFDRAKRQANITFVQEIQEAIDAGSNMTEIAREISMDRSHLHVLLRTYGV